LGDLPTFEGGSWIIPPKSLPPVKTSCAAEHQITGKRKNRLKPSGFRRETLPGKAKVLSREPFGRRGISMVGEGVRNREKKTLHPKKNKMAMENHFKSEIHLEMVGFPLSC